MTSAHRGWLFACILAIGCAPAPGSIYYPGRSKGQSGTQPSRVKLAVLPIDNRDFPAIALSLNNVLHDVKVRGVDDYFLSKATLEVVQLSIECVEQTATCYSAVGKQLGANRLLLGRIAAVAAGKRKHDHPVRVSITLFDVDGGEAVNEVSRIFRSPEAASQGATDLVAEATGDPPRYFGPDEEPATKRPGTASMAKGDK
jgi:hypothetical protein